MYFFSGSKKERGSSLPVNLDAPHPFSDSPPIPGSNKYLTWDILVYNSSNQARAIEAMREPVSRMIGNLKYAANKKANVNITLATFRAIQDKGEEDNVNKNGEDSEESDGGSGEQAGGVQVREDDDEDDSDGSGDNFETDSDDESDDESDGESDEDSEDEFGYDSDSE